MKGFDEAADIKSKLGLGVYRDGANRKVFEVYPQYYFKNYNINEYRGFLLITMSCLYLLGQTHDNGTNRKFGKLYITGTGDILSTATVSSDGLKFTFDFGNNYCYGGIELVG